MSTERADYVVEPIKSMDVMPRTILDGSTLCNVLAHLGGTVNTCPPDIQIISFYTLIFQKVTSLDLGAPTMWHPGTTTVT